MSRSHRLQTYINAFEQLSPKSLHQQLADCFAEDVFFKDPFNAVTGKVATLQVFEHMFVNCYAPKFVVLFAAEEKQTGLLQWQFTFQRDPTKPPHSIDGMSRIQFNANNQVIEHIDYWDSGEFVYQHVPVLRWGIKAVNAKLRAT